MRVKKVGGDTAALVGCYRRISIVHVLFISAILHPRGAVPWSGPDNADIQLLRRGLQMVYWGVRTFSTLLYQYCTESPCSRMTSLVCGTELVHV